MQIFSQVVISSKCRLAGMQPEYAEKSPPWRARSCRAFYLIYYLFICVLVNLYLSLKIINS